MNPVVLFLAQLLGPVYIAVALMVLFRPKLFDDIMDDFRKNPALIYFSGILAMVTGMAWMLALFSFESFAEGLFSVLGLLAFAKGLMLILAPEQVLKMTCKCSLMKVMSGLIAGGLGVWCICLGFGIF